MGAFLSSPIDDAAQERINKVVQDAVQRFSVEFANSYTQTVVKIAKEEVEPGKHVEDALQLQCAPIPSAIIKAGMLTKRGHFVKNWKVRYVVAYNAADNYKIDRHDGTDGTGRMKGTIYCNGYRAQAFEPADTARFGEYGIKLVPSSSSRETWYIKCSTDKEREEWLPVFENACFKAEPPHDEDERIATAFDAAMRKLRWSYGFHGWYDRVGSEAERLSDFISKLVHREVVSEIIDGIVEGPLKKATADIVRSAVSKAVNAAAHSSWVSSSTLVRGLSESIQASVNELIQPLIEKQVELKEKIASTVSQKAVEPFLETKGAEVVQPVVKALVQPLSKAYMLCARGFHGHMLSKVKAGEFDVAKFSMSLERCDREMEYWFGPLHDGFEALRRLYEDGLTEVASVLVGGATPQRVYLIAMDKVKLLAHRAVYTFGQLAKTVPEGELVSVLGQVTAMLGHDCVVMEQSVVEEVLSSILDSALEQTVLVPCNTQLEPLQAEIDELPMPGMSTLFDLPGLLEETVSSTVSEGVSTLVASAMRESEADFKALMTELSVAQPEA